MVSISELYWGEISALLGALFSAVGNTLYRLSSEEMDLISISLIRNILGFPFFMAIFVLGRDFTTLFNLDGSIILLLVLSVIFSITIGDFAYLAAQHYVGVSRAAPITNLTPLITLFEAFILLGESLTEDIFVGTLLVCLGVVFITRPSTNQEAEPREFKHRKLGYGLAFMTPVFWSGGYLVLRVAMSEIDTISANVVRYFFAILFMGMVSIGSGSMRKIRTYRRQFKIVVFASFFNIMLGSLFWLESIKYAGASRAATLGATAPMFALPLSMLLLDESISWKLVMGTVLTLLGIWLVF